MSESILSPNKDSCDEEFLRRLNVALETLEEDDCEKDPAETFPTLHVFGIPRSGTTLATQLIASHLDVGYIDHVIAAFWKAPTIGIRLSRKVLRIRKTSSYSSAFGRTAGVEEPHEFGYFWRNLLGYEDLADIGEDFSLTIDWQRVRRVLMNMANTFERPVMFKSFWLSMHIGAVQSVLPKTCFLRVKRDLLDSALSLLRMRRDFLGSQELWASMKPAEYSWLSRESIPMQLAGQVYFLERMLDRNVAAVGGRNVLEITYEALCKRPTDMLSQIQALLEANGAQVERLSGTPTGFAPRRPDENADPAMVAAIRNALEELNSRELGAK